MNRLERAAKLYVAVKSRLGHGSALLNEIAEEPEVVKLKYPPEQIRQRLEYLITQGVVSKARGVGGIIYSLKGERPAARARTNGAFSVETSVMIVKGPWKRMLTRSEAHELWQALNEIFKNEQ